MVLLGGKIWTGEPMAVGVSRPPLAECAQAVAIASGRILAVGTEAEIRPYVAKNTQVIDLAGRLAVPGFIDSHVHFLEGGFQLGEVNLKDADNEAEFITRIAAKAAQLPSGRWMLGGNWDESSWPGQKLPSRWMIDPITPHHPVFLRRSDGHAALANSLALKMAGISQDTFDPAGGAIVRDPCRGEPTGALKDNAQELVSRIIPPPSQAEAIAALQAGLAEAARVGVTSVHNMNLGSRSPDGTFLGALNLLSRARAAGWLTCRFYEIVPILEWRRLLSDGTPCAEPDGFIQHGAVKAFADGSLGSRTAWMDEPYADDPSNTGLPTPIMDDPRKLESLCRGVERDGLQLAVHAIGTRACHEILSLYEAIGGPSVRARRFRIEHAQHLRPEDFARFGRLGAIASMQPYHAMDDGRWAEKRLGAARARWSYAWRSMLDSGVPLAFGSDWPVAPLNPLLGLYAAVTRATLDASQPNGWFPEERITLDEALRAYTAGSAFAAFHEREKGTIAPGKLADIAVLSDDLFSIPPEKIKDACAVMTLVGGKMIYPTK